MNIGKIFPILGFVAILTLSSCSSSESTPEITLTTSPSAEPVMPQAGDAVEAPGVTLTVESVSESDHLMLNAKGVKPGTKPLERLEPPTGGRFITVATTVENTGLVPWDLTCSFAIQSHVFNDDNQRFDDIGELYRIPGNPGCNDSLNPGFTSPMIWSFAVPQGSTITHFGFADPETNYNDLTMIDVSNAESSAPTQISSETPPLNEIIPEKTPTNIGTEVPSGGGMPESNDLVITSLAPEPTHSAGSIWSSPGNGYNCAGTDAWVHDPSSCIAANLGGGPSYDYLLGPEAARPATITPPDPATIPFADGGTCAAAICGYGHNQYGQRNPSSGEIQTLHGCQDGYITDTELCSAVAWVEGWQY